MNPFVHGLVYGGIAVVTLLIFTALGLWFERKFAARMQSRVGPNVVGPFGLLQPIADVVKLLQKEHIVPDQADRILFVMAPAFSGMVALGAAAVIPFVPNTAAAELDVGMIYILAIGALAVMPVFIGGWASNNKFALLGAMRALAQSVAYEVPLVLAAMVPVILAGSLNISELVKMQADGHWLVVWPFFLGIPAFFIFYTAMLAEANRIPFDIPESESELVAGVTTEYTGMQFALFMMAEYVHTLVASTVAAALFLGGWDGPFAPGVHWMVLKTVVLFASVYLVRWTLLRFRSDQLLRLCWHRLVPGSVLLVFATALWVVTLGK